MATATPMHLRLETQLRAHLGPRLAVVCTGVDGDPGSLLREERVAVAQAVPRRQREFAAGREAAREAMRQLGLCEHPVPANPDRSPCWPPGLLGTLSHSSIVCLAVLGKTDDWLSIGIDIESDCGIDKPLWDTICSSSELDWINAQDERKRPLLVSRIFTAKEAFYKSCSQELQANLEFHTTTTSWCAAGQGLNAFSIANDTGDHESGCGFCLNIERSVISWILVKTPSLHLNNKP